MKIKPKLINYRNAAFIAFLKDTKSICEKFNTITLKLDGELAKLSGSIVALDNVFGIAKGSASTDTIENLDARRDNAFTGISFVADAYTKHFETEYREAAKLIAATTDKYGKRIASLNYLAETETLRSLLSDFENQNNVRAAIVKLNLTEWVNELKAANTEFNQVYLSRNKELSAQPDQNVQDLKKPAIENYNSLMNLVSSYNTINPNTDYKKIVDEVEELVIKYNANIPTPVAKPKTPPQV
jgi:hypothetical protein